MAGSLGELPWASLMVFERRVYHRPRQNLCRSIGSCRSICRLSFRLTERIVRLLEEKKVMPVNWLVPGPEQRWRALQPTLRRFSKISGIFFTSLELVKQGMLKVDQEVAFPPMRLSLTYLKQVAAW